MSTVTCPRCDIAIVGAGIAGLAAATALSGAGREVTVFDKARGAGGRMSTRRGETAAFDHGAQYFTARDPRFLAARARWHAAGWVAPWTPRLARALGGVIEAQPCPEDWWVPVPGMNALARQLCREREVRLSCEVVAIERHGAGWRLQQADGSIACEARQVLVTAPAAQAHRLLRASPALQDAAAQVRHAPCWVALVVPEAPIDPGWDAMVSDDPVLAWIARNDSKPGRGEGSAWVLHAQSEWSQRHLEHDPADVAQRLCDAFARFAEFPRERASVVAHRWRYARVVTSSGEDCHYDSRLGLGLAGDGCRGPRVEDAWLSGTALAGRVLDPDAIPG